MGTPPTRPEPSDAAGPSGLTAVIRAALAARHGAGRYLVLAVLAAALLWPGIGRLPPVDRAEARTVLAAVQILHGVDAGGQGAAPYAQAAAVSVLGAPGRHAIWANRVPGALTAMAAVLLTCRMASVLYGAEAGFLAGLLLALSVLLGVQARLATADAPLLAVVLVAQLALLEVWRRRDDPPAGGAAWTWPMLFWAANGVGLLLKGPAILVITFGTLLGLAVAERQVRWMRALRPGAGVPLTLAIVLPVALLPGGLAAAWASAAAVFAAGQGSGGPPGTYLVLFLLTFWPGSLFVARAVPWVWASRGAPGTRFLLAWSVPAWMVCEALPTKLPADVLPTYPAVAALAAAAICAPGGWRQGWLGRRLGNAYAWLWMVAGFALALGGPAAMLMLQSRAPAVSLLAAAIAAPLLVQAWRQARRPAPRWALGCAAAAGLVISLSTFVIVLPGLQTIWLAPRIAAAVRALRPCPDSVLASASFSEPSLVYLVGRQTSLVAPAEAADFLHGSAACGLALVGTADEAAFRARAQKLGLAPRALTRIDGIDHVTGRRLALTLYAAGP